MPHRRITLLYTTMKLFRGILKYKLKKHIGNREEERDLEETDRSTTDAICIHYQTNKR